eukprot:Skav226521  [mRNA]  locus=scaffold1773:200016:200393:- [translate_table: standard]
MERHSAIHLTTLMSTAEQYLRPETLGKVKAFAMKESFVDASCEYEEVEAVLCSAMVNSPSTLLERRLLRRVLCPLVLALEGSRRAKNFTSSNLNQAILQAATGLEPSRTRDISESLRFGPPNSEI